MAREYFNAYHSYLEAMEPLNDAERGRLFTACLKYSMTGEAPKLRGNERFVFYSMKSQIDRDTESYEAKCGAMRANASKRWDAKACKSMQLDAKACKSMQGEGEGEGEGKDKGGVHPPKSPQGGLDGRFARFWEAYPKKVGKGAAETAWRKRKPDDALLSQMLQAIERAKQSPDWTKDGGQYIPNPATWLNQRRWEDEIGPVGEFDNLQRLYEMFREEGT